MSQTKFSIEFKLESAGFVFDQGIHSQRLVPRLWCHSHRPLGATTESSDKAVNTARPLGDSYGVIILNRVWAGVEVVGTTLPWTFFSGDKRNGSQRNATQQLQMPIVILRTTFVITITCEATVTTSIWAQWQQRPHKLLLIGANIIDQCSETSTDPKNGLLGFLFRTYYINNPIMIRLWLRSCGLNSRMIYWWAEIMLTPFRILSASFNW